MYTYFFFMVFFLLPSVAVIVLLSLHSQDDGDRRRLIFSRLVLYSILTLICFVFSCSSVVIYLLVWVCRPAKTTWRQQSWTDSSYCLVFVSCRHFSPKHIKICSSTSWLKSVFRIDRIVDQPDCAMIDADMNFSPLQTDALNDVRIPSRSNALQQIDLSALLHFSRTSIVISAFKHALCVCGDVIASIEWYFLWLQNKRAMIFFS